MIVVLRSEGCTLDGVPQQRAICYPAKTVDVLVVLIAVRSAARLFFFFFFFFMSSFVLPSVLRPIAQKREVRKLK